jgi:hypothetical protein
MAVLLGSMFLSGAIVFGTRWQVVSISQGAVWIDKWTGHLRLCRINYDRAALDCTDPQFVQLPDGDPDANSVRERESGK